MSVFSLVLVSLALSTSAYPASCSDNIHCGPASELEVFLDTDTAMTVVQPQKILPTDIDDDLAFLFALGMQQKKRLSIKGVVSTFGNANSSATHADMISLAQESGFSDKLVAQGGDFNTSLSDPTPGGTLLEEILQTPRPLGKPPPTITAIGSMFTLANVVTINPRVVPRIGGLLMLGGSVTQGHYIAKNTFGDLNFKADPLATNLVLALPVRKVVITMELCMQVLFTQRELDVLNSTQCNGAVIANHLPRVERWLHEMGQAEFEAFHTWAQYGNASLQATSPAVIPWDTIAMAYLVSPELFGEEHCYSMQLQMSSKAIISRPVSCDTCQGNGWVNCVIAPTRVLNATRLLQDLTSTLCEVKAKQ